MRHVPGKFFAAALAASALTAASLAQDQGAQERLARPAIDAAIFRPGEVQRRVEQFMRWQSVCDEVTRLRQRFCSLETLAEDSYGRAAAKILVSTMESGRPAAMAFLPLGLHIGYGLRVALPAQTPAKKRGAPAELAIPVTQCSAQGCIAAWALSPAEIAVLNSGGALTVKYLRFQGNAQFAANLALPRRYAPVSAEIRPEGFREAVAASVRQ